METQRTTAAQAFAARSMVLSPLLGGGLITATMPLLVVQFGVVPMLVMTAAVMLGAWWWPGANRGATGSRGIDGSGNAAGSRSV